MKKREVLTVLFVVFPMSFQALALKGDEQEAKNVFKRMSGKNYIISTKDEEIKNDIKTILNSTKLGSNNIQIIRQKKYISIIRKNRELYKEIFIKIIEDIAEEKYNEFNYIFHISKIIRDSFDPENVIDILSPLLHGSHESKKIYIRMVGSFGKIIEFPKKVYSIKNKNIVSRICERSRDLRWIFAAKKNGYSIIDQIILEELEDILNADNELKKTNKYKDYYKSVEKDKVMILTKMFPEEFKIIINKSYEDGEEKVKKIYKYANKNKAIVKMINQEIKRARQENGFKVSIGGSVKSM